MVYVIRMRFVNLSLALVIARTRESGCLWAQDDFKWRLRAERLILNHVCIISFARAHIMDDESAEIELVQTSSQSENNKL